MELNGRKHDFQDVLNKEQLHNNTIIVHRMLAGVFLLLREFKKKKSKEISNQNKDLFLHVLE